MFEKKFMWRRKILYLLLFVFCIWLALATRTHRDWFHPFFAQYGGDTIWAGMFLFFMRIFFNRMDLLKLALICFALGVADEALQLCHAPWIEVIRGTRIGGLLLGYGFLWSDIICYAVGIAVAYVVVIVVERKLVYKPSGSIKNE